MLYPLSYGREWRLQEESDLRPLPSQGSALSAELCRRGGWCRQPRLLLAHQVPDLVVKLFESQTEHLVIRAAYSLDLFHKVESYCLFLVLF